MKNNIVVVKEMKSLIKKAPGFKKKELADYKLDIIALCEFGCRYCSSNEGNYLRINRKKFAKDAKNQIGRAVIPKDDPSLMMVWHDVVGQLENELSGKPKGFGAGLTLMFSMLTDGFSPSLVREGTTKKVLKLMLDQTSFRIRVLTKNAIVGSPEWLEFFVKHKDRFVVGLSIGSLDDAWSKNMERGTSSPSERFEALANLQRSGVPTFGMLCPVFPDIVLNKQVEEMVKLVRPEVVENIWVEPYNDRNNWAVVRDGYTQNSPVYKWFTDVYDLKKTQRWSAYATELYLRLRLEALEYEWLPKLKYLLYEDKIMSDDAPMFRGLDGVLLQSKPGDDGLSKNPHIARLQR